MVLQVDVQTLLAQRAPKLAKRVPRLGYRLLQWLICQKELNELLQKNQSFQGVDFMRGVMQSLNINVRIHGEEFIPKNRPLVFASNHPLGGVDGLCIGHSIGRLFADNIRFVVNDILYHIPTLQTIFLPVNKYGTQSRETAQMIRQAFDSDTQIIVFPAGLCSRKQKGRISDRPWGKMFVQQAIQHKRDIVPMFFDGENSSLFYLLANIRERLGIKFNAEMLLLPREMLKKRNFTFDLFLGKPIPYESLSQEKNTRQWASYIREECYRLKRES